MLPPDPTSLLSCDLLSPVVTEAVPFDRDFLRFLIAAPPAHVTCGSGLGRCHIGNQFTGFQKVQYS